GSPPTSPGRYRCSPPAPASPWPPPASGSSRRSAIGSGRHASAHTGRWWPALAADPAGRPASAHVIPYYSPPCIQVDAALPPTVDFLNTETNLPAGRALERLHP